ncbi:MAG: hypothetical protein QN229_02790 [Desulfurococcaceae archaeon TW002]
MAKVVLRTLTLYLSFFLLVSAVVLALAQRYVASLTSLVAGLALLNYVRSLIGGCSESSSK